MEQAGATLKEQVKGLCAEFRSSGSGDPWGDTMGALFPICERLYFRSYVESSIEDDRLESEVDSFLAAEAQFGPPAVAPERWPEYLSHECGENGQNDGGNYWAQIARDTPTEPLLAFGRLLNRLTAILKERGLDY
jgi:hypothetical protein